MTNTNHSAVIGVFEFSTKNKISVHQLLIALLLSMAVFGYVISVGKLYAFHVVMAAYWVSILLGFSYINKKVLQGMLVPFLFLGFMCLSLLWTPNIKNGLYFIFYFICGYTLIFAIANYATDINRLSFIFKVLAIFFVLNFFIGLLETTGYFRLPVSPYYGISYTPPSGFNSNLNNFGFVFISVFPFLFLYPKKIIRYLGLALAVWFTLKLESKGFFLGLFFFFVFYLTSRLKKKRAWLWLLPIIPVVFIFGAIYSLSNDDLKLNNRAFSAFEQIERSLDLVRSNNVKATDSTSTRTLMYLKGLEELHKTNGLGVGAAGIGTKLALETNYFDADKDIFSFHNFFLEMLVDIGIVPFLITFSAYLYLAFQLLKIGRKSTFKKLNYFSQASAFSLLAIIPASISPSSIIYVFTFWIVIGFSLATYLILKREKYEKKYHNN